MASIYVTHQDAGDFDVPGYPFSFPHGEPVELTDAFARNHFHTTAKTLGERLARYNIHRETPKLAISTTNPKAKPKAPKQPKTPAKPRTAAKPKTRYAKASANATSGSMTVALNTTPPTDTPPAGEGVTP